MNILITNDDGIYSPGIAALAQTAREFGTVKIVAPDVEQSSMGHAITHSRPLSYRRAPVTFADIDAFRVNGTPADCVALGLHMFPDTQVVLSGINMGPNLGNSMWHSGTLAAAKQATLLGITGIALSTPVGKTEPDFEGLSRWTIEVLKILLKNKGPALYNVNFPPKPQGLSWTRQSVRLYDGRVVPGEDPMGRENYWITVVPLEPAEKGTDRWAVEQNLVSITPLRLDLTAHDELAARQTSEHK
ncbi:5'/3'-nucleotidase SurE [Sphingobacterium multivorum]|uniref:5'-nucleotidase SurE n=1 Tax=Sphingobacterium multivorum TaxID=28454 RepID=A0ABX7CQV8_SPHMU|nr:5'/3'-nucleotidase SurE [Sphingobacterium multivorum]QQT54481.1 5'/3'-nucleotidase SurE [Sphingobacterium multivorum]